MTDPAFNASTRRFRIRVDQEFWSVDTVLGLLSLVSLAAPRFWSNTGTSISLVLALPDAAVAFQSASESAVNSLTTGNAFCF